MRTGLKCLESMPEPGLWLINWQIAKKLTQRYPPTADQFLGGKNAVSVMFTAWIASYLFLLTGQLILLFTLSSQNARGAAFRGEYGSFSAQNISPLSGLPVELAK